MCSFKTALALALAMFCDVSLVPATCYVKPTICFWFPRTYDGRLRDPVRMKLTLGHRGRRFGRNICGVQVKKSGTSAVGDLA